MTNNAVVGTEKIIKKWEESFTCKICYEPFNTCVITPCSHCFCSLCIRKYLNYKTQCPLCSGELFESSLIPNRIVDDLLNTLPELKIHNKQLKMMSSVQNNVTFSEQKHSSERINSTPQKNIPSNMSMSPASTSIVKIGKEKPEISVRTDMNISLSPKHNTEPILHEPKPSTSKKENAKIVIPAIFQSPAKRIDSSPAKKIPNKLVPCPVCNVDVKDIYINNHLDDCLKRQNESEVKPTTCKRKYLPKRIYNIMSLGQLRDLAREYKLNSRGTFETLKRRIQKYVVLYNSECDKANPRPVSDIIKTLEEEEKISYKKPKSIFAVPDNENVGEVASQYLKLNKSSFEELIKTAKSNLKKDDERNGNANEVQVQNNMLLDETEDKKGIELIIQKDENSDQQQLSTTSNIENDCKESNSMLVTNDIQIDEVKLEPCSQTLSQLLATYGNSNDVNLDVNNVKQESVSTNNDDENFSDNIIHKNQTSVKRRLFDDDSDSSTPRSDIFNYSRFANQENIDSKLNISESPPHSPVPSKNWKKKRPSNSDSDSPVFVRKSLRRKVKRMNDA